MTITILDTLTLSWPKLLIGRMVYTEASKTHPPHAACMDLCGPSEPLTSSPNTRRFQRRIWATVVLTLLRLPLPYTGPSKAGLGSIQSTPLLPSLSAGEKELLMGTRTGRVAA